MRKIFFALTLTVAFLLNTPAFAKDVWISSGGNGSAWYVIDETIDGGNGKFCWTNAKLKLVERNGDFKIVSWNFTQTKPDGGRLANWVYEVDYGDGKKYTENVLTGTNAEKILLYCLNHSGL
ncbi:MAG: hypothetical protein IJ685_10210 [Selenomonadaceae bacterium]|nr:hypothetical protein [Selenomonadaceae bacterium]